MPASAEFQVRREDPQWKSHLLLHGTGLLLCVSILAITVYEKFFEGAWLTVLVTSSFVAVAFLVKRHYLRVREWQELQSGFSR